MSRDQIGFVNLNFKNLFNIAPIVAKPIAAKNKDIPAEMGAALKSPDKSEIGNFHNRNIIKITHETEIRIDLGIKSVICLSDLENLDKEGIFHTNPGINSAIQK